MDSKIKEWIKLARKLSKYLLRQTDGSIHQEIQEWEKQDARRRKLLKTLSHPSFYAQQAAKRKVLDEKFTWDNFVRAQKKKVNQRRIRFVRYAASVMLLLAVGCGVLFYYLPQKETPVAAVCPHLTPGSMKASLILDDGKEVILNTRLTLTEKDGTIIQNDESGELAYQKGNQEHTAQQYHTLRVPRGGEYRLVLADGTRVWVNSESELSFPTRFLGNKREVSLKGEAYFEIAHNTTQPFFVNSNQFQVHATGTAFNVMAYQDEPELKVILVEGGVDIEENQKVITKLTPNQQFALNKINGQYKVSSVDPRTATAWKNGSFFFDNEMLSSIIRKLARWYDVDILCDKPEIEHYKFSGEIRKYEDALQVLNMLKLTNEIAYTIQEDKKIIIHSTE